MMGEGWWGGGLSVHVYKNANGIAIGDFDVTEMPGWSGYESSIVLILVGSEVEEVTLLPSVVNTFMKNKAMKGGGGLYWVAENDAVEPSGVDSIIMIENEAGYGNNKATSPKTLEVTEIVLMSLNDGSQKLMAESGSIVAPAIEVMLKDAYGETVKSDSSTAIFVKTPSTENTPGYKSSRGTNALVVEGVAIFDQMGFETNLEGVNFVIYFYAPALTSLPPSIPIDVTVNLPEKPEEDRNELGTGLTAMVFTLAGNNFAVAGSCTWWLIKYNKRCIVRCVTESIQSRGFLLKKGRKI